MQNNTKYGADYHHQELLTDLLSNILTPLDSLDYIHKYISPDSGLIRNFHDFVSTFLAGH